ncbi:MAG: hypothetical protein AAFN50_08530 [Pseudomonadota bacterium]
MRILLLMALLPLGVSAGEIFTRDGVTDGDTFFLAPHAMLDSDPALQSWVTYSLMRSTCKLEMGGDNPARNSSFDCEFKARRHLVSSWEEKRGSEFTDAYLDALSDVEYAGFLAEYTVFFHGKKHWVVPEGLRLDEFREWRRDNLRGHKPRTRLVGSWNYAHNR